MQNLSHIATKHDIKLVVLFGSRARGGVHKHSDVDIAVYTEQELSAEAVSDIEQYAIDEFEIGSGCTDVVELKDASPLLAYEITRRGKLLFGSQELFYMLTRQAWRQYLDTARLRRARHERLKDELLT
ncbi:MAG: nucleotidyltransferase domain-containing protein [bacterium]|nr:nucleotidyltransferase domain-containing protein [bacterium]